MLPDAAIMQQPATSRSSVAASIVLLLRADECGELLPTNKQKE